MIFRYYPSIHFYSHFRNQSEKNISMGAQWPYRQRRQYLMPTAWEKMFALEILI